MSDRPFRAHTTCRHFNGVQHKTCPAGVAYQDAHVPKAAQDGTTGIACLRTDGAKWCAKFDGFTEAELDAKEKEAVAMNDHVSGIFAALAEQKEPHGSFPCPKCLGIMRYQKKPLRVACETPDCLKVMA